MHKYKSKELSFGNTKITIDYYNKVTSTMTIQKEGFVANFYTIVAKEQTLGYGRLQRSFESEKGGLYFSTQIKSNLPLSDFTPFSLVSGLSILKVLKTRYPSLNISLKYPNDIYINDKKFGGILIENFKTDYYILGIGLNVNNSSFSESLKNIVTSLKIETGFNNINLDILLEDILKELHQNLIIFEKNGFNQFHNIYSENCLNLQKNVYITYKGEKHLSKGIQVLENGLLETLIDENIIVL